MENTFKPWSQQANNGGLFSQENKIEFNDNTVLTVEVHKSIGLSLDKKLDFNIYIDNKINKCSKPIGIMKLLSLSFSRKSLLTLCKICLSAFRLCRYNI